MTRLLLFIFRLVPVLRSKERGLRYFDLGFLPARRTVSDKEYNIGYFKRGFCVID